MQHLIFPYQQIGKRILPVIKVKLLYEPNFFIVNAYVDSGASISIFSDDVAEILEVDYKKGKEVYPISAAGKIKAYQNEISLEIGGHLFKATVLFSNQLVSKFNLLGLKDVFDNFEITFDNKNKRVSFKKN